MSAETETANNPTDAAASSTEAAAATLLSGATAETTTQQTQTETEAAKTETADAKPETVAPEKYEFKAPEGKEYDANILDAFSKSAKEANLTQDAAQKLLDSMSTNIRERQAEQIATINQGWMESSKTDKEFGGEALQANLAIAKKGLDQFASPELKSLLDSTKLGSHPEVIRMFIGVGKALSEDKFVGGRQSGGIADKAAKLYNHPTSQSA